MICDRNGRVAFANKAAEAIADTTGALALGPAGRALSVAAPSEMRILLGHIADAAAGGPGGVMHLTGGNSDSTVLGLVAPLPRRLSPSLGHRHAMLALRPIRAAPAFSESTLMSLFGLSTSQASIALLLFRGATIEAIAAARGVKVSTVRTHLSEVFVRTCTEGQLELIRLLADLPPIR